MTIKSLSIFLLISSISNCFFLENDADAYTYCLNEPQAYIAIIWPLVKGHKNKIYDLMNRWGKVLYRKKWYFNKITAYTILKEAHQNVPSQQKHCGSMKEHLAWYFPDKSVYLNPAHVVVVYFENSSDALACKYAIRNLFPQLQYRSIHINDFHYETIKLAGFFFIKQLHH